MSAEPLKPCPFCGERPRLTLRPDDAEASTYFAAVACYCGGYSACAHKMETAPTADEAEAKVRSLWNTRATLDAAVAAARASIDEALIGAGLDCMAPDEPVSSALQRMLSWERQIALDPAVSSDAAALVAAARAEERAAERERWEAALRQTWQMVDPLMPPGTAGSYWRGQDAGITAALKTLRENIDAAIRDLKPEGE